MEEAMLDTRMTAKLACCMALAFTLALGTAAMAAQQRSTATSGERGDLDEIRKVSTLIGADVMNRANTKVANLRDLVLSPDGDVPFAILGYGGVAGVGETNTAIPFDAMEVRHAGGKWSLMFDTTSDNLKKAPTIESKNYRELTDAPWIARVQQFVQRHGAPVTRPAEGTGFAQREPRAVESVLLATKVRGTKLKNPQNEDLGKVEDMLLDRMYRVAFLIVGRGGALGIGEQYIPVPWSRLGISTNPENAAVTTSISATKDQMDKAPMVKGTNYETMLAKGFADEVRRYFGTIGGARERR